MSDGAELARAEGVEEGLATALAVLESLAGVMIEREQAAAGGKANHARRVRIKAYQVAAKRIGTRLQRQRRLLSSLETPADEQRNQAAIESALKGLGL